MLYFTRSQRQFIEQYRPGHEEFFDHMVGGVCESVQSGQDVMENVDMAIFAAFLLTPKAADRQVEAFFCPDYSEPEELPTAKLVSIKTADSDAHISMYEEGCLTSHEMAKAVIRKMADILALPDQGCDGLPPNDVLGVKR